MLFRSGDSASVHQPQDALDRVSQVEARNMDEGPVGGYGEVRRVGEAVARAPEALDDGESRLVRRAWNLTPWEGRAAPAASS